jgi:hypothetical protein
MTFFVMTNHLNNAWSSVVSGDVLIANTPRGSIFRLILKAVINEWITIDYFDVYDDGSSLLHLGQIRFEVNHWYDDNYSRYGWSLIFYKTDS